MHDAGLCLHCMEDADTHRIACSPVHTLRRAPKFSEKPGAIHPLCYSDPSCEMGLASCNVDKKSCNINALSCQTSNMMRESKAFRCVLPPMREDQLNNLQRWAQHSCALSTVFRADHGVVLVGLKDTPRGSASFSRTVRTALRRRGIDVPLRGHWCTLTTVREVVAVCGSASLGITGRAESADARPPERAASPHEDDPDVRVVPFTR